MWNFLKHWGPAAFIFLFVGVAVFGSLLWELMKMFFYWRALTS